MMSAILRRLSQSAQISLPSGQVGDLLACHLRTASPALNSPVSFLAGEKETVNIYASPVDRILSPLLVLPCFNR